jgi:soluble lytic murein transglycosylase
MISLYRSICGACAACVLLFVAADIASAASDPYRQVRARFQRAYAEASVSASVTREEDSEALRAYPLYPYLQAARIKQALTDAGADLAPADQQAQTFITYYDRDPVGRDLRRAWLTSLAQRKLWQTYLEHYRAEIVDDTLECHSYTARIVTSSTENLEADIRAQWLTPNSLPECEQAFEWLRSNNALSEELIEARVRLALEDNNFKFARQIAAQLPAQRATPLLQWAALLEQPQRQLDTLIANPNSSVQSEALLAGWSRLVRTNRDAALARFERLVNSRKLTPADASKYSLALAFALAWDRRPEALTYFKLVQPADLDDYALEWQTRAAIWVQDWDTAAKSIAAMSDTNRKLARWRYWAARAAEHAPDEQLARQLYESLLIDDNFYSMMAAARLNRSLAPHPEKLVRDDVQLAQIEQLPELVRARELLLSDLRPLAYVEWRYGFERLSEDARNQAIHLAARWGWFEQAISTASSQRVFNDYELLYPRPYDREVRSAAKLVDVSPELIYGVMRQESLYQTDAVSSAGAYGLLQLLPETARRTARAWKRPKPAQQDLFDPAVNVTLGAAQLRAMVDRFGGQTLVALAGYNAGPNAAVRWLPSQAIDSDVWIENIPYNETRTYVQRILWHTVVFKWLATGEPQTTDTWLARVAPVGDARVLGRAEAE